MCVTLRKTKLLTRLLAPMSHCTLTCTLYEGASYHWHDTQDCPALLLCPIWLRVMYSAGCKTLQRDFITLHSYTNLKCFIHGVNLFILFLLISKNIIAFSILLAIRLIVLRPCFICTLHLCFTRLEKRGTFEKVQRHFPLQSNRFSDKLTV